jgi:hypothetical protein
MKKWGARIISFPFILAAITALWAANVIVSSANWVIKNSDWS